MQQRLTIVTLGVCDLAHSAAFYTDVLNWKRLNTGSEGIVFFQLNGMLLSLYPANKLAEDAGVAPPSGGFSGVTLAHNVRSKDEVDILFADLERQQAHIVKHPQTAFWGGYSGYFADPDGHLWEVAFNPFMALDEAGNVSASDV